MFYFVSILLLALLDMVATHYQVEIYGTTDIEANPLMRWVMATLGMHWAYAIRVILPAIGVALLLWAKQHGKLGLWSLRLVLLVHIVLVAYHFYNTDFFTLHLG